MFNNVLTNFFLTIQTWILRSENETTNVSKNPLVTFDLDLLKNKIL